MHVTPYVVRLSLGSTRKAGFAAGVPVYSIRKEVNPAALGIGDAKNIDVATARRRDVLALYARFVEVIEQLLRLFPIYRFRLLQIRFAPRHVDAERSLKTSRAKRRAIEIEERVDVARNHIQRLAGHDRMSDRWVKRR